MPRSSKLRFAALALFAMATMTVEAAARSPMMETTGTTSQPIGHYEFCMRYADRCQSHREAAPVRLNQGLWNKIVDVNRAVNESIFPKTDMEMHQRPDVWSYPTTEGDCEDYALLKQYMLERAGLPISTLLVTVVLQANGEGHAVLTVRTDRGDFILDNLEDQIFAWDQTEYRYLKRQAADNSGRWAGIFDDRNVLVGSVN